MRRSVLGSQNGGSLLTVMIASATMVLLTTAALHVFSDRMRSYSYVDGQQALIDQFEKIRFATSGIETCNQLVTDASTTITTGGSSALAHLNIGSEIINLGTTGSLNFTQFNVVGEVDLNPTYDSTGVLRNHKRVHLEIVGSMTAGGRTSNFDRSFPFDVLVDPANLAIGCYRGQNVDKVACDVMGGAFVAGNPSTCNMPPQGVTTGTCPASSCIYGFDSSNQVMCRPL